MSPRREDPVTREAINTHPVLLVGRPMWKQVMFWIAVLAILLSVSGLAVGTVANRHARNADQNSIAVLKAQATIAKQQASLAKAQAAEAKTREDELHKGLCSTLTFIGSIPLHATSTSQLRTIVKATHDGAIAIHCPGVKP